VAEGELLLELEYIPDEADADREEDFRRIIGDLQDRIAAKEAEIVSLLGQIEEQYLRIDGLTYRAPISGTVMSHVDLWEGSRINNPVEIVIARMETLTLSGEIFQSDIQRVEIGMPAEVETYVWGEYTTIPGTLSAIDRNANQTGAGAFFPVVISVDNSMGQMMEGFGASFFITLERSENPIVVPFQAVKYFGRDNFVWLKPRDGKRPENVLELPDGLTPPGFYPVKVTPGISSARYVEIIEGLSPEWRGWEVFTQKTDVMPSPRPEYEGAVEWEGESREAFDDGFQRGWEARDNLPPEEDEDPFGPGFEDPFSPWPDDGWEIPVDDWNMPEGDWDMPTEDWEIPEGDRDIPSEDWEIPEGDWDMPAEDWETPSEDRPAIDREPVREGEVIVVRPGPGRPMPAPRAR